MTAPVHACTCRLCVGHAVNCAAIAGHRAADVAQEVVIESDRLSSMWTSVRPITLPARGICRGRHCNAQHEKKPA